MKVVSGCGCLGDGIAGGFYYYYVSDLLVSEGGDVRWWLVITMRWRGGVRYAQCVLGNSTILIGEAIAAL
jgi:hypothetical protein